MNNNNLKLEKEFSGYLDWKFGEDFLSIIPKPDDYYVGERMLYKLKHKNEIKRNDNKLDEDVLKDTINETLGDTNISSIEIQPPVTTNNIEPRLIDLPGSDIIFDIPLMRYFQSDNIIPSSEFNIEWLIGVYFGGSEKKLVSIDMAHPFVKGIFSVPYEIEMDLSADPQKTVKYFKEYIQRLKSLCKKSEKSDSNIKWVKLVQLDNDLMSKMRKQ